MNTEHHTQVGNSQYHGTLAMYVIGFIFSIVLTLGAYDLVYTHVYSGHEWPSHEMLIPLIVGFALVQLVVQLACFLHVRMTRESRWNLIALVFAAIVVCILVGGSLWVMYNLSYNMTIHSPEDMQHYMLNE